MRAGREKQIQIKKLNSQIIFIFQTNWRVSMEPYNKSAFNPINLSQTDSHITNIIEKQCKRIFTEGQKIEIPAINESFVNFPHLLRLILSIYLTLSRKCQSLKHFESQELAVDSFFGTHIKYSLLKIITSIIQKKLFVASDHQAIFQEVSYSLIFKQCLIGFVISFLSENSNFVILQKFINFYKTITSQKFTLFLPVQIYYLYGGALFSIQAKTFREKMMALFQALGKTLSQSETIINRNIQAYKSSHQRKFVLDESVKIVMLSKDKQAIIEVVSQISTSIFGERDYLNKDEFLNIVMSRPLSPLLSIFFQLIRSEAIILSEKIVNKNSNQTVEETNKPNFYANQLSKLFNKCPFNGDDRCNCKKCQCVRRNRESAKLSQQKKRNAVEQVTSMKETITSLESQLAAKDQKIRQLEQENMMFKSLLKEMRLNPHLKSIMRETIEPISKVLNNEM